LAEKKTRVTRGQIRESFDPAMAPVVPDGTVVFVAPNSQRLLIFHKDAKKVVVNGEVVTEPPIVTQFENFMFTTSDQSTIERIRNSAPYKRGEIQDLESSRENTARRTAETIADQLTSEPLAAKVMEILKTRALKDARTQAPSVEETK
jgi:hypothetical protein